jgi:hypothetical protein
VVVLTRDEEVVLHRHADRLVECGRIEVDDPREQFMGHTAAGD